MSLKLGRLLGDNEVVDHIDDDPLNNDLSNLQVLTPLANHLKWERPKKAPIQLSCPVCNWSFERKPDRYRMALKRNIDGLIFCSRSCAARNQYNIGASFIRPGKH